MRELSGSSGLLYAAPLLAGDDGTEQTIQQIRSLVDDAWKDSSVNAAAIGIIRDAGAEQYDGWAQVRAIYDWVRRNFYFVNDPVSKEALRPAADLLEMKAGDCDDINAIVLPSLLGSIGYETRLVTIAGNPNDPTTFSHIYAEVWLEGNWIPVDAARPGAQFASAPPRWYRREWWSLTGDDHEEYPGVGQMVSYGSSWPQLQGAPRRKLGPRGIAGLGFDWDEFGDILQNGIQATPGIITAVNGQPVLRSVSLPLGPGGYGTLAPTSATLQGSAVGSSTSLPAIALLIGAGILLFAISK